jgi:hypothetical protein
MRMIRAMLAASGLALAALSGCTSYYLMPPVVQSTPNSIESKEHWDLAMAGVAAKNEEQTRAGLKQLTSDARTTPLASNDREYWMIRLQKVSYAIDMNDWQLAGEELQSLRWRYGRM